jgi:hypothetical protein
MFNKTHFQQKELFNAYRCDFVQEEIWVKVLTDDSRGTDTGIFRFRRYALITEVNGRKLDWINLKINLMLRIIYHLSAKSGCSVRMTGTEGHTILL